MGKYLAALFLFLVTEVSGSSLYQTHRLENGLEVISMPAAKVPLATVVLCVKAGAMTETQDISGLTHLWEHMFFKGNARLKNQEEFNRRIRQLGITYNGDTSSEMVRYYFTLPSAFLDDGLQFMADAIATPLLEKAELERERLVVLNEYDRNASQPGFDLYNLRMRILYGDLFYRRNPLGDRTVIEKATREQLLRIKKEVFVPGNSALLIAGDIEPGKIVSLVEKHFKSWRDPKGWKAPAIPPFQSFPNSQQVTMIRKNATTPELLHIYSGPRARMEPADTHALDMLITLLHQRTGRLYKKMVDSGLALSADLGYHTQSQVGEIYISAEAEASKLNEVEKALDAEIAAMSEPGYFKASQLDDARRALSIAKKRDLNRPSAFIKDLAFWWAVTGLKYYDEYIPALSKLTEKDVTAIVRKYLKGKNRLTTLFLNPQDAKSAARQDNAKPLMQRYKIQERN